MSLLNKYRLEPLTLTEKAIAQCLPERLTVSQIAELWTEDGKERLEYVRIMEDAIVTHNRRTPWGSRDVTEGGLIAVCPHHSLRGNFGEYEVLRDNLTAWLNEENAGPVKGCLLANWWPESEQQAEALGDAGAKLRKSQLHELIGRVYIAMAATGIIPTSQQVWAEIRNRRENYDTEDIIQEVDGQMISWCSGYGAEQKLARKSFDKTLSNIKNDLN